MKTTYTAALLLLVISVSGLACATPTTYYVSADSGSDTNTGLSWAAAKLTIHAAVDLAADGDTVLVTNGTYSGGVVIPKAITVRSVNGPTVTPVLGGGHVFQLTHSGAVLEGFYIYGGHAGNIVAADSMGGGVCCGYDGSYGRVGSVFNGLTNTIRNCMFVGNYGSSAGAVVGGTLENCLLAGNSSREGGSAASHSSLNNCTVVGNVNLVSGAAVFGCVCRNTIIYDNANGTNYDAGSDLAYCCTLPMPLAGAGNITGAPGLAGLQNPHLASSSPCINAGRNADAPPGPDIDGAPRTIGGAVDIGCDEFDLASATGYLSAAIQTSETNVLTSVPLDLTAAIIGVPLGFEWNFGDGTSTSDVLVARHAWHTQGLYTVSLSSSNLSTSALSSIQVLVTPVGVNRTPVAYSLQWNINEDTGLALSWDQLGRDPDNDPLTLVLLAGPAHGSMNDGNDSFRFYRPAKDYFGHDEFTFALSDGVSTSEPATVSITVFSVDDPTLARAQTVYAVETNPVPIVLSVTDIDGPAAPFDFRLLSEPAHGSLRGSGNQWVYSARRGYVGVDSFRFEIYGGNWSSAADVTIIVEACLPFPAPDEILAELRTNNPNNSGGPGWITSAWLGRCNYGHAPWIYHPCHGWLYQIGDCANEGLWFYTLDMEWLWTSSHMYPWLYRYRAADSAVPEQQRAWLYYAGSDGTNRTFWNARSSVIETWPDWSKR